ncbi:MAG: magnesium transporter [Verrucomicrobiae bacterium]|nr:magnesium transporter [Verrucomicrobiae bacterium]
MSNDGPLFIDEYVKLHPVDLADRLERLSPGERAELLTNLPLETAAAALAEVYDDQFEELTEGLSTDRLVELVGELEHDDAADILGEFREERREELLEALPNEVSDPIEELLRHPEDTAGGIMNDRFITLSRTDTVKECLAHLREQKDRSRVDITYLYVIDEERRLVGIVPLRELVFSKPDGHIEEIMVRQVQFLRVDDDQEEVARRFDDYRYMALPVLDRSGKLVGVIDANDAFEVAQEEATEDMQLMVGLSGEERFSTPWKTSLRRRLPWLFVNLATAFLAAIVVGFFEETIAKWTALAVFLPIVAGQGGNAGMQTLTVIIRDMALGDLEPGDGKRALFKETLLGLLHGIAIGMVVGLIGWAWKGSPELGLIAGAAMLLNLLAAALSGVLIPFGLKALKIDPALASSIILTTVTDVAGFFFFLSLGAWAIKNMN